MIPDSALPDVVRRWIQEGWTEHDASIVDRLHSADFVDHDSGSRSPDNTGFKQGITALCNAFPDLVTRVEDIVADETTGRVAVRWSAEGTQRATYLGYEATNRRICFKGIEIVVVRNGRIAERWGEWDGLDLLEQLRA